MRVPPTIVLTLMTTQMLGILRFFLFCHCFSNSIRSKMMCECKPSFFPNFLMVRDRHHVSFFSIIFLSIGPSSIAAILSRSASHSVWPSIIVLQRVFTRLFWLFSPPLFLPSTQTISTLIFSFHLSSTLLLSSFHLHFLNYLNAIFSVHLNTLISLPSSFLSPSSSSAPVSLLLRSLLPFSLL